MWRISQQKEGEITAAAKSEELICTQETTQLQKTEQNGDLVLNVAAED